ncbi:folylpolyglutamate synthase [Alkalihalobacillus alcalophilus ATCC 27647 = CGMCC 1.3604]|uniref:Dihydrofolate synthase/folylpolyglutamate synthase n=1 Tax=Alkalihalobacillus alcalophilus ATCC 27647 = CGMCC 1.3604 TaxID=1218173 RepID=A0A094WNS5_ALKAL|nr:folylpolyglutamate synthase/dihydrofolate synthase family protein [Alkalihalobacillus alcalophilus]KGA97623.1 folylpolyglutamate synthase [Alkalihalobacillus alcalophilus ATCC 27647 = CGMCC 1.3604]MED1561411.1 bifunctional folylpolyglutamate synthase/dihydrofolate synthase [Alkalihalobacillus alcalophilus]THG91443.1 folylpolyglutamate synthase [Alkalihalobacillus alcalophilus ATCC 27647 = CGMCC 1.3604]
MKKASEAISWIHSLLPFGIKPGLKRMEWMLERLENPEKKSTFIHIAGTNGKGSTVSYLRNILESAGYSVGTFTSPFIECFEERISLNGHPISEEDLLRAANKIRPLVEELAKTELSSPTEFEVITTMAFEHFAHQANPDFVLMEVGLGGRFDSTNVLTPIASVITSIGHDHMHILGNSIEEIASEKAGIIKAGVPVISGVLDPKAANVIQQVARNMNANLYELNRDFSYQKKKMNEKEQHFSFLSDGFTIEQAIIEMKGEHQLQNASVALKTIALLKEDHKLHITEDHILKGLKQTSWIGRFEILSSDPLVVIDGAHNEEGLQALAETLKSQYPTRNYRFVFSATKEKDTGILLAPFKNMDAYFTFTEFEFFKAATAKELYENAPIQQKSLQPNWRVAVKEALKSLEENEMLIITGSLYFISDIRKAYQQGEWDLVKI